MCTYSALRRVDISISTPIFMNIHFVHVLRVPEIRIHASVVARVGSLLELHHWQNSILAASKASRVMDTANNIHVRQHVSWHHMIFFRHKCRKREEVSCQKTSQVSYQNTINIFTRVRFCDTSRCYLIFSLALLRRT